VRLDKREIGRGEFFLDDDRLITGALAILGDLDLKVIDIQIQTGCDRREVFFFQVFPGQHDRPGGMIGDNHAFIAIEDLAPGRQDRELLHAVTLGQIAVNFRLLDLQLPETGDQENEDRDRNVLKCSHLPGREAGIVANDAGVIDFTLEIWIEKAAHGGRNCSPLFYLHSGTSPLSRLFCRAFVLLK